MLPEGVQLVSSRQPLIPRRRCKVQKQETNEGREEDGAEYKPPESDPPLPPQDSRHQAQRQVSDDAW
jgi:hypothetical protein